jgi:hypothetical protein
MVIDEVEHSLVLLVAQVDDVVVVVVVVVVDDDNPGEHDSDDAYVDLQ